LRLSKQHNRDYNITAQRTEQGGSAAVPIKTGETYYCEGNEVELAAVGNVAVATIGERLFLRGPLAFAGDGRARAAAQRSVICRL